MPAIRVFVLDKRKNPLMPCHPARAKELLDKGRAVVHRLIPFVIRLKDRVGGDTQPIRILFDPGSKKTGIAVVRETAPAVVSTDPEANGPARTVLFKAEVEHRGWMIKNQMERRANNRKGRRSRNLRYRAPRFDNRRGTKGWLPPSLRHRVETTMTWANRFMRWCPVTSISMELVRFDMQKMETPEIDGVDYQRGTLFGYELRGYVLEKGNHACAYCGARDVPLNLDHVVPRAKGGSNRVSNLVAACIPCNERKAARPLKEFLKSKPDVLRRVMAQLKAPLKDAAAVNTTRRALWRALKSTGLPVETASGGRTKWNRVRLSVPKTHANDAACVGRVSGVERWNMPTLAVKCTGRGAYQRTRVDKYGFWRGTLMKSKSAFGFRTGDIVHAVVTIGKKVGTHVGRAAIRERGYFNIRGRDGVVVQNVGHRYCKLLQRADGYGYAWEKTGDAPTTQSRG